jgi:uncharacterized membrane protein SpoIIM required for sporulation
MSEVSYEEANSFAEGFSELVEGADGWSIFANNAVATLPMFVPGFGIAWGFYTAWSTGFGFAAIISTMPELSEIQPLSILFLSPFGLMELVAYSIAISCSCYIILVIIKNRKSLVQIKSSLKSQIKPSIIKFSIVMILLLVAAFLEEYMIKQVQ